MVEPNEIFDFWGILSNDIIGDVWLTIFLFVIAIIFMTIKFKMPFELQLIFMILILSALYSITLIPLIWVFVVLIVGGIAYWLISQMMK